MKKAITVCDNCSNEITPFMSISCRDKVVDLCRDCIVKHIQDIYNVKLCPSCGGKGGHYEYEDCYEMRDKHWVECQNCRGLKLARL